MITLKFYTSSSVYLGFVRRFMTLTLKELTKDIDEVNVDDILSCWQWLLVDMKAIVTISVLGDLFLLGKDQAIYWLQTDSGGLTRVADNLQEYQNYLSDDHKLDNWFLPLLVEKY